MAEQVILDFVGDPSGLKPVADALTALGKLTDEQQKDFAKANEDFKRRMQENAKATQQATSSVEQLSNGAKEISKTLAGAQIKESTKDLGKFSNELINAGKQSQSLKARLREIKTELNSLEDEGSARFQELSLEAAKLQDKIGDVSERIRVLASDTFAIDAVVDGVRGLTAAFTVAQSASALFGKENEDLQKALLKVQAATGLLMGVQEIANQITGQGAAKLAILSVAQKVYTFAVGTTTGALKAFRIALLGTGIGAIIFLLYEAANAMGLFTSEVKDNTSELEKQKQAQEEATKAAEEAAKARQENIDNLRKETDQLTKSREKLLQEEISASEQRIAQINNELKYYDSAGEQINKLSEEIKNSVNEAFAEESGINDERRSSITELARIQKEEAARVDAETLSATRENLLAKVEANKKAIKEIEDERLKKAEETNKKLSRPVKIDDSLGGTLDVADYEKRQAEILALQQAGADEAKRIKEEEVAERLRLDDILAENEKKNQEEITAKLEEEAAKRKEIEQASLEATQILLDTIFQIEANNNQAIFDDAMNKLQQQQEAELSNVNLTEGQKNAIREKYRQQEANLKRQQFEREKQAAIVQATIDTALAVIKALPNYVNAALAAVAGAAQIAVISSQPTPQFAVGTDYAPGGAAWVGEKGTELVKEPSGKMWLTPNEATLMDIKRGSQIIPNFKLSEYADMVPNIPSDIRQQFEANKSYSFDYKEMGKAVGEQLMKNPTFQFNIDKNGVNLLMIKGNRKVNFLNNRYSSI